MSDLNLQAALEEASKLAAKLKEERDEALEEIKRLRLYAQKEDIHHDRMIGELERVYAERDEAREKYDAEATEHMLAINKVCGERDEARAQAKKLEGAYEDATNYYARWSELIEERDEARGEAVRFRSLYYTQLGIDGSASWFPWEANP
jgi:uncharacterized coiled-coil DUF342 family protein